MKKTTLIIISITFLFIASCNKEEIEKNEEPKSLLEEKTWWHKTLTYTSISSGYSSITYCFLDSTNFNTNGEYTRIVCESLQIGHWKWEEIDKTFVIEEYVAGELKKNTYTILNMNEDSLNVRVQTENLSDYYEYKYHGRELSFNEWFEAINSFGL